MKTRKLKKRRQLIKNMMLRAKDNARKYSPLKVGALVLDIEGELGVVTNNLLRIRLDFNEDIRSCDYEQLQHIDIEILGIKL